MAAERHRDVWVCLIEKDAEIGAHILSRAVIEPRALDELLPDWRTRGVPLISPPHVENAAYLKAKQASMGHLYPRITAETATKASGHEPVARSARRVEGSQNGVASMVNNASSTAGAGCVPLDAAVIFAHAPPLNRAEPRRDSEAPRAATARDHTAVPPPTGVSLDEPLVSALCTCVLGERDEWAAHDWPPRSVAELLRYSANGPGFPGGLDRRELSSLLEEGLAALDDVTFHMSGQCFARVDAATRLLAVFHLESGQAGLSGRQAAAFMDAFLTLAAEAYLCNALEPNAPPAAARIV